MNLKEQISAYAKDQLGIDLIGFCDTRPLKEHRKDLEEFLRRGYQGEMHYLEKSVTRTSPEILLPGAKSVVVIGINYYREKPPVPSDQGGVARYAWGRDYHKVLLKILKNLAGFLEKNWPEYCHKICVDAAPLSEKALARRAGLGFYGKNTLLINPDLGSFFLLGEIITTMPIEPDAPRDGTCGTCTRCLDACPTKALIAPGQMDARRCLSYLTIESKSPIPEQFHAAMGNQIFGCDICQEVCPYNIRLAKPSRKKSRLNKVPALSDQKIAGDSLPLKEVLAITGDQQFLQRFAGSPLMRAKRSGLTRNAIIAAKNVGRPEKAAH